MVSLYISWFDDPRGKTSYYLERIQQLNIPKPTEVLIPFSDDSRFETEAKEIARLLEEYGWDRAFLRTDHKAAISNLQQGSFIQENSTSHIAQTIESLINQNNRHNWVHGEYLVVREWMDLNFCMQQSHSCHPEIRYFIDDGEIIGRTPLKYDGTEYVCSQGYDYLADTLEESEPPQELAESVAEEFDEATWGVDFALTTNGVWKFVEMNFNGVYWNTEHEEWWNMCGQNDNEPFSPVWEHESALPDLSEK